MRGTTRCWTGSVQQDQSTSIIRIIELFHVLSLETFILSTLINHTVLIRSRIFEKLTRRMLKYWEINTIIVPDKARSWSLTSDTIKPLTISQIAHKPKPLQPILAQLCSTTNSNPSTNKYEARNYHFHRSCHLHFLCQRWGECMPQSFSQIIRLAQSIWPGPFNSLFYGL